MKLTWKTLPALCALVLSIPAPLLAAPSEKPPAIPAAALPIPAQHGVVPFPHFEWMKCKDTLNYKDPIAYQVEIAKDKEFATLVDSDTVHLARYVCDKPLEPGTYFWRVRARKDGQTSQCAQGEFTIDPCEVDVTISQQPADTDAYPAFQKAMQSVREAAGQGKSVRLSLEKGDYHVRSHTEKALFSLTGLGNVIIDGRGSMIHMEQWGVSFAEVNQCKNIVLRNFIVDWDKELPFSTGVVQAVDLPAKTVTVKMDDYCPGIDEPRFMQEGGFHCLLDPEVPGRMKAGAPIVLTHKKESLIARGEKTYTITINGTLITNYSAGDRIIFYARSGGGAAVAAGADSVNVTYQNITTYTTGGAGHYSMIKGSVFNVLDCRELIKPGRRAGGNADGVHVRELVTGPWIERLEVEGIGDDAIAMYSRPVKIKVEHPGNDPRKLVVFGEFFNWEIGNEVVFFNPRRGEIFAEAVVKSITPQGDDFLVEFDREIKGIEQVGPSPTKDDQIWNRSKSCGDFMIRDCTIRNVRRFGAVFRSQGGVVERNRFEGCSSSGIIFINEPWYPNGPFCSEILVMNNTIKNCAFDATFPYGASGAIFRRIEGKPAQGVGPRNILFANNQFVDWHRSAIALMGAENVLIQNNLFSSEQSRSLFPDSAAISLYGSRNIEIQKNRMKDSRNPVALKAEYSQYRLADNDLPGATERDSTTERPPVLCPITPVEGGARISTEVFSRQTPRCSGNASLAFGTIPENLTKGTAVTIGRGAQNSPGAGYSFRIGSPATVYLLVHERGSLPPLEGWEKTELKAKWDAGGVSQTDSVFKRDFEPGVVAIPEHPGMDHGTYAVPNLAVVIGKRK